MHVAEPSSANVNVCSTVLVSKYLLLAEVHRTAESTTGDSRSFLSFSIRLGPVLGTLIIAACIPFWFGFCFGRYSWLAELTTHFTLFYAQGMLPLAAICCYRKTWGTLVLVAVTFAASVGVVAPLYVSHSQTAGNQAGARGTSLRAMSLNVLTSNGQYEKVLSLIRSEQPDVIILLEVNQQWVDAMRPLEADYPVRKSRVRSDNFGVALYSKLTDESVAFRDFGGEVPSVVANLATDTGPLLLIGTHPLPPSRPSNALLRNETLDRIAEFSAEQEKPVLVMGDLNITPFSPFFRDLLFKGRLRNSQRGYGYQPTWRSDPSWLALPIDHALHNNHIKVVDRSVGPDVGSDHLPLIVDFELLH